MRDTLLLWCDRIIRYSFYVLFFFVPLVVTNTTSELYELNKMWLTWEITLFVAAAWFSKMILRKQFSVKRTPLDIPLMFFLLSQILATIFSIDPHTSFWGYYSRFNGGLLSTIAYIFLYYAAVSNLGGKQIRTILKVTFASGMVVALWGLPSHFGKDPTCLLFRGTLDVTCWTEAFKPTVRIFSTLGQPAWMSAYINILIPLTIALAWLQIPSFLKRLSESHKEKTMRFIEFITSWKFLAFTGSVILFFICLLYTGTRAGVIAFWVSYGFFWFWIGIKRFFPFKLFLGTATMVTLIFVVIHFFLGTTFAQLDTFTYSALIAPQDTSAAQQQNQSQPTQQGAPGGTDSGKIRQVVWQGAIDVWKAYPVFGSGAETFAYAYYQHRPADHNLTSEWDYLYNKAHNEYLNYLATTGVVGLGTYLLIIGVFFYRMYRYFTQTKELSSELLLSIALTASFISILITNFFGFSVVIINLYFFLIPAFIFIMVSSFRKDKELAFPKEQKLTSNEVSGMQWTGITTIAFIGVFLLIILIRFWYADKAYALGSNLSSVQEYQQAYLELGEAISLRPSEPVFRDEFAVNNSLIATLILLQYAQATPSAELSQQAQLLAQQAITLSNDLITKHPKNISFWKNRVRIFYTLSQADPRYLPYALDAVKQVHNLAPTDAKVLYNLGALYQESGMPKESAETLEKAILMKPDYRDAYFALALAYNAQAVDKNKNVINRGFREKAIKQLRFILERLSPDDKQALDTLHEWESPNAE